MDADKLLITLTIIDSDYKSVVDAVLEIREILQKYLIAKDAYIELTNNRDHANNCYYADNELMNKFDRAFE